MDFRLVRGDKSDRAQFCRKISWDFDTERGRLAFVARLIGLANEAECRIIGAGRRQIELAAFLRATTSPA